eukprot:6480230-Amphidinium_carterae.2
MTEAQPSSRAASRGSSEPAAARGQEVPMSTPMLHVGEVASKLREVQAEIGPRRASVEVASNVQMDRKVFQ